MGFDDIGIDLHVKELRIVWIELECNVYCCHVFDYLIATGIMQIGGDRVWSAFRYCNTCNR